MATSSTSLGKWRDYFSSADSDIFNVIKRAIMVAASDYPSEFKLNRGGIAELLFACKLAKCSGCGRTELAVPSDDPVEGNGDDKCKCGTESRGIKDAKESKAYRRDDDDDDDDRKMANVDRICDQSYEAAEALSDEIEEETRMVEEVSRIKGIIDDSEEESDLVLFELLRHLQQMPLSVEILTNTRIGKSVHTLQRHGSKEVRNLARALIDEWKNMLEAWVSSTAAIADAEATKESAKTTSAVAEEELEEGLPSPPMDEGDLLATPASMELSKIFDGMDDDGNIRNDVELENCKGNVRKWSPIYLSPPQRKLEESLLKNQNRSPSGLPRPGRKSSPEETAMPKPSHENLTSSSTTTKIQKSWLKKDSVSGKPKKPPNGVPVFPKPKPKPKPVAQPKINNEVNVHQKSEKGTIPKKPISHSNEKSNCNDEPSLGMKLEIAKRKLQERYQEAERAKKQRTIQVMELSDLPKQSIPRGIRAGGSTTILANRR